MHHRFRVPTPVLMVGTAVALVGVLTALTLAQPARSSAPDRCTQFALDSRALARTTTGTGRRVAVIGDSYAAGLALTDPATAWTRRLPGQVQVFAFSGSGFARASSSCHDVAYDQRAVAAAATDPAVVVAEGGLNDVTQSDAEIRAGFRRLLATVGDRPLLVVGPVPAPARLRGAERVDRTLRLVARRTGTPYLSMIGLRLTYLDDQLHLTVAGHRAFGDAVAKRLRALR
ncbi:MAG: SGNH/GDSL hydrolase family protein [Microbacterium sp.]|nr:MAG: SGNH/GDSL hydrolase family protein [Microbacterium sp.]